MAFLRMQPVLFRSMRSLTMYTTPLSAEKSMKATAVLAKRRTAGSISVGSHACSTVKKSAMKTSRFFDHCFGRMESMKAAGRPVFAEAFMQRWYWAELGRVNVKRCGKLEEWAYRGRGML